MATDNNDNVQHGIDDNPSGDPGKGAALGGLGGAAVGAAAGSLVGPAGTVVGAAVGAISGAVASGAAVSAVDAVDNDNTVSGLGGDAASANPGSGYTVSAPGQPVQTEGGTGGLTTPPVVASLAETPVATPEAAGAAGTPAEATVASTTNLSATNQTVDPVLTSATATGTGTDEDLSSAAPVVDPATAELPHASRQQ